MKKIMTGKIKIGDIKFLENSRLRSQDDVADLMVDIEQRGLLEPIGIRLPDNALIYGNRRVRAFKNLNYEEIDATFFSDVSDEDLLIMNVVENIKRKSIGSIEIGRICKILKDKGITNSEIAGKLGINKNRVEACIASYNITLGTPFEKLVTFGNFGTNHKGISEGILWKLQTSLGRARRLTKDDWNIIMREIEKGKIITQNITQLRNILLSNRSLDLETAISMLDKCKIVHMVLPFDIEELGTVLRDGRYKSESEFVRDIIKKYNKNLLF